MEKVKGDERRSIKERRRAPTEINSLAAGQTGCWNREVRLVATRLQTLASALTFLRVLIVSHSAQTSWMSLIFLDGCAVVSCCCMNRAHTHTHLNVCVCVCALEASVTERSVCLINALTQTGTWKQSSLVPPPSHVHLVCVFAFHTPIHCVFRGSEGGC